MNSIVFYTFCYGSWQFTDSINSWNWHGFEGKKTLVEVYSKSPYVKLVLNGKKIGIKKIKNFRTEFKMKYNPGELVAISLDENKNELLKTSLITGDSKPSLKLNVSKKKLNSNNKDLSFVEIEFVDNNGNLLPSIEQRVDIKVEGDAIKLIGFGSGLCKTDETFDKTFHDSYRGRALACFKSTDNPGKIVVSISSDGVKPVKLTLESK